MGPEFIHKDLIVKHAMVWYYLIIYTFFYKCYFLIFEGNEEKIMNCTFKDTLHSVILV